MFELKVKEEEKDGFIYKIMQMDLGDKKEETYIKLPISEKEYLTNMYDPYIVFNIFKMMSIGGDCYIKGKVTKSLLDNLDMFVNCWRIWLPDKCKSINIISDEEIDDCPRKLNNDAVLSFSGGLDSVSTLYRHHTNSVGRNNKNIKKLLSVSGGRDRAAHKEQMSIRKSILEKLSNDLGYNITYIETNLNETSSVYSWVQEVIAYYVSIMMLYQDTYNNLLIASDQFINPESLSLKRRSSNPISNKFLQSNRFRLITDGEFLTRFDKMNSIKNWRLAIENLMACDGIFTEENKCCGVCTKCYNTKFNYKLTNTDIDFNKIYVDPSFDLSTYHIIGDNYIFYEEAIYYNKIHKVLDDKTLNILNLLIEENKFPQYFKLRNNYNKLVKDVESINNFYINKINNFQLNINWFNCFTLFSISNNKEYIRITILGLKFTFRVNENSINKIAWWIPVKKWRDNFRAKFKL